MIYGHRSVSPRLEARVTGALYFISGWAFTYGENTVRHSLIIPDNAAQTANNILTHLQLYRRGLAADLVSDALFLLVTLLLYDLLRPVNQTVARVAAPFSILGCTVGVVICFFHLAPLVLLQTPQLSAAFTPVQLQSLAFASLKVGVEGTNVSMIFFGCFNVFVGYLIFRSGFMPRIIGILLSFAGISYLVDYFVWILDPATGDHLLRYLVWEGTAGEGSLILWLLIVGVNSHKWLERAAMPSQTIALRS